MASNGRPIIITVEPGTSQSSSSAPSITYSMSSRGSAGSTPDTSRPPSPFEAVYRDSSSSTNFVHVKEVRDSRGGQSTMVIHHNRRSTPDTAEPRSSDYYRLHKEHNKKK
ncbi:hypothetical protein VTJ49DRAFT_3308 [Mycothermus thermophilus]|uniref:Uncharacterized protein n=1 Tax=Humicola insolens TaxID=85995 RepID=A0ABR3V7Y1_HUMIN